MYLELNVARRMRSVIRLVLNNFAPGVNDITKITVYSNLRSRNSELLNEFHHFLGKPVSMTSSLCCIPIRAMDSSLVETFKPISDKRQDDQIIRNLLPAQGNTGIKDTYPSFEQG
jgi:hypothetical protein